MPRELNLPIYQDLKNCRNIMFIGLGGGFDIFSAMPLSDAIKCQKSIFVNSSGSNSFHYKESTDYPEGSLQEHCDTIYSVGRHGVKLVSRAYAAIVDKHEIDTIIAVDGGVDSLMRGDEQNSGTVLEDFIALAAISNLDVPVKILSCVGFGCETEEDLNHYCVLENIAHLTKDGYFLGSCSMTSDIPVFAKYQEVCKETMAKGRKSHIQTKIIGAVNGEFGDYHMYKDIDARVYGSSNTNYFVNPLMALYWFFDLNGVIQQNLIIDALRPSNIFADAMSLYRKVVKVSRQKKVLPL